MSPAAMNPAAMRRAAMRLAAMRPARGALAACVLLLAAGCAAQSGVQDIAPGEIPPAESDEAGLWMVMDRAEQRLRASRRVVEDPALNRYARDLVCELSPGYCGAVRLYIVRAAGFNASMAPNGVLHIWTGLLLRVQNEAQLAFVLGHELAHYQRRHTLKRWRTVRSTADSLAFVNFALAGTGIGLLSPLVQLAALGGLMSYSRDQEREADALGFERMSGVGYDPAEAQRLWDMLLAERKASADPERDIFFATHPGEEERSESLAELAAAVDGRRYQVRRDSLRAVTAPHHDEWLRDELQRRDYGRFAVVLDRLRDAGAEPGLLLFYRGEMHRLRGAEDDDALAVEAYGDALATGRAPPETLRALGLIYQEQGRDDEARQAFEGYLARDPTADDRAMIEYYLERLRGAGT